MGSKGYFHVLSALDFKYHLTQQKSDWALPTFEVVEQLSVATSVEPFHGSSSSPPQSMNKISLKMPLMRRKNWKADVALVGGQSETKKIWYVGFLPI